MNKLINLFCVVFVAGLVFLSACGPDDSVPPTSTAQETALDNLTQGGTTGTWTVTSATGPNGDVSADFGSTTLTFTPTNYSIANAPATGNPFEGWQSGTWAFASTDVESAGSIILTGASNTVESTISFNGDATVLTLNFTIAAAGGRVNGIEGNWTIRFGQN